MPSAKEQIADHLANRRVRSLIQSARASQARSAYAAYASTPIGSVMAVSKCSEGQMPRQRGDQLEPGLLRDQLAAGALSAARWR